ncbi:MAG: tyrosine-type recombinase/integrase [Brevundimonas sp.]
MIRFEGTSLRDAENQEAIGTGEILAAYSAKPTIRSAGTPVLSDLVRSFRSVPEGLPSLAKSTQKQWTIWLDRIDLDLGTMPLKLLNAKGATEVFFKWRDKLAARPRSADYAIQVLRRVLSVALSRRQIDCNPAVGIAQLYRVDRSDQVITDEELATVLVNATPRAAMAIRLAAATGIRRGDLVALRWEHVQARSIAFSTSKSRGRTFVNSPLFGDGRTVIEELRVERDAKITNGEIPSAYVLTTDAGTPWLAPSLTQAFIRAAGAGGVNKRLHDLRGTAATRFILKGFSAGETAEFIGWEPARVAQIIKRYVNGDRVALAAIERLEKQEARG